MTDSPSAPAQPGRVLQRVVLPLGRDADVLPLYVELGADHGALGAAGREFREQRPEHVLDRRRLHVDAGTRASFATYFNAFPASYWRRWTVVEQVQLEVVLRGQATVNVYRSTASGSSERVVTGTEEVDADGLSRLSFTLPLNRFADGGWYWFDLVAGQADCVLESAQWRAVSTGELERADGPGTVTLAITTYNRPTYLLDLLDLLAEAPDTVAVLDQVLVVDQGTDRVRDQDRYAASAAALGDTLRIVEQPNVGGSGGFARGMYEALQADRSRYVLLMDDDVVTEPECILRGAVFADLCRRPTIVGGHMLNLVSPSRLHNFGEVVRPWRFFWGPADNTESDHDFSEAGLRATPWMHRRIDVDYNAWWMCMIPLEVVKTVGLALPLFIKWDDAEFGVRAGKAGFPTVSLPGMAVWHMPWSEKDDTVDWQAYFHLRNRLVAGLIHSPFPRGGRLVRETAEHQAKHLIAMQYSVAHLRIKAMEDVLRGPEHLHAGLATALPEVRAIRATYVDAQASSAVDAFPAPQRRRPPRRDAGPQPPSGKRGLLATAAAGVVRQLMPVRPDAQERPQAAVPAMDAKWWRLSQLDSAVVSASDGTAAAWYRRDRDRFLELSRTSAALNKRLLAEWPRLAAEYRAAADGLTSPDTWRRTFADLEAGREAP